MPKSFENSGRRLSLKTMIALFVFLESALKTFGVTSVEKNKLLYFIVCLIWGIIPLGFIIIVISIQIGIIK